MNLQRATLGSPALNQPQTIPMFRQMAGGQPVSSSYWGDKPLGARGELTLQKVGSQLRVLWNGELVVNKFVGASAIAPGSRFGIATRGPVTVERSDVQPTAPVVFRDDFMRATGPDDPEVPDEWQTTGTWKTSGTLGPKSDVGLNPNPFVFRAASTGAGESRARAGKWFWSDYAVSASVRATQNNAGAPLVAALEAFGPGEGAGVRGEIDFARGVARLKQNGKVLAQSAPFDVEPGGWHRVRLEPGPGEARLLFDGVVRAKAKTTLGQGGIALAASAGGANFVDFDDVRVGAAGDRNDYGDLPDRFKVDRLIRYWANDALAWTRDAKGVWWHTGDFFGPVRLELPLPKLANPGDGVRIYLGKPANGVRSDAEAVLTRVGTNGAALSFIAPARQNETKATPAETREVFYPADATQTLVFSFVPDAPGAAVGTGELSLGGQTLRKVKMPRSAAATKLGVSFLKAGVALGLAAPQNLAITSGTWESEGRSVVGVNITPITPELQKQLGLPDATGTVVDFIEPESPGAKAGLQVGDVVRGVNGAKVVDVETMRAAVGAVRPGAEVTLSVLRPQGDASGLDWAKCRATSPQVVDYAFTSAPVDWRAARGKWEVSERWTCSPQWSFFAGSDDAAPTLWSRFATQGDYTLEAFLATPMDLTRGERSPSDLNISVEGDGRDLASGYSFLFGAKSRAVNRIYKGDSVVWEKPFEMPAGVGDTHQDWFYVRLERRATPQGLRFRWSVNGREVANYLDPKPRAMNISATPAKMGGALAFWTQNGGLSIARVRLWHSGITPQNAGLAAPRARVAASLGADATNGLGVWSVRGSGTGASARLTTVPYDVPDMEPTDADAKAAPIRLENPQSGGDWTVYVTRDEFDPNERPVLTWDYALPSGVKVNLYAKVAGQWREIVFSGGASTPSSGAEPLGTVAGVVADKTWRHATFDLGAALRQANLGSARVQALAFAAPDVDYLRAGLGGNHQGAAWQLHGFTARAR